MEKDKKRQKSYKKGAKRIKMGNLNKPEEEISRTKFYCGGIYFRKKVSAI